MKRIRICLTLTRLEALWLAHAVDVAAIGLADQSQFPGDWPRGERAALRRMVTKLQAALPPKEAD